MSTPRPPAAPHHRIRLLTHRPRLWPLLFLWSLLAIGVRAEDVPTEPPQPYQAQLAPLLTPLEQVLALPLNLGPGDLPSGAVLIDERLQYVEPDGRKMSVHQLACKSLTEAGAKENAEEVFSYRKKEQKFYVVRAEAIQPDGTIQSVKPNAILVQSPQRQAQYSLYDDQAEVRIIYPNVKPGTVTRVIVVTEDLVAKLPGEYMQTLLWTRSWPTGRARHVVDLPAALASRLQIDALGAGIPAPARESRPGDRVRLTWTFDRLPPDRYEPNAAPASQFGPSLHLTTLKSWDQIGQWFNQLARNRDQLAPALATRVDAWTKGVTDRDEIVRLLYGHAANDVRYVGLEFGEADYQPHDCNEVWENQYGDCKDKATLLVAFLRHTGIPANVVLLNTDHAGLVDRRSPAYNVFTHAIAALSDGHGGWQFCDPTISAGRPGLLSPHDADRDVLVVTANGAEWAHTPPQSAGAMRYEFDLKLSPAGELSGWLTLTAEGYDSASERNRFEQLDPDETRSSLTRLVRGFYSGAEVVDVVRPAGTTPDTHVIKAYFVVAQQGGGATALVFPQSGAFFYDVGHTAERRTPFFLWRELTTVHATIALPPGLAPSHLPEPYRLAAPSCQAEGSWRFADGVCQMELQLDFPLALLPAADFPIFYNATQSFQAWLEKPVLLAASGSAPASPAPADNAIDLPLMPTGDGQLNLVDARYPESGNHALRRAALNQTLLYFPRDRSTVFRAHVRLANLDWNEDKNQEAVDRLQPLLAGYKADVSQESYAWAESTLGLALADLGKKDEARDIFVRLARTPELPPDRRAVEALHAANLLRATAPDEALALLTAAVKLDSEYRGDLYALLARLLLRQDRAAELRTRLTELQQGQPQDTEAVLAEIVRQSARWDEAGEEARRQTLLAMLTELVPAPGKDLQSALAEAKARQQVALAAQQIQTRLKDLLAAPPLANWYKPPADPALKTQADFDRAIKAAADKREADQCLQLAVLGLVTLPPSADFPHRLWRTLTYADWKEVIAGRALDEPIHLQLLDLCDQLPAGNDDRIDGRFFRALHLGRKKDYAGQQEIFLALIADPGLPADFLPAAYGRLGDSLLHSGDYPGALKNYRAVEKYAPTSADCADQLLKAVLLNLHLGQTDEALRIIGLLEQTGDETLKKTSGENQIRAFISLLHSGQAGPYWAAQSAWWPEWESVARDLALPAPETDVVAPVIPDLEALGTALGATIRDKNATAYFQTLRPLISAARWLPGLAIEVGALGNRSFEMIPTAQRPAYRRLLIGLLAVNAPETPADRRRRQVLLAANYFDGDQPAETLRVAAAFRATVPTTDSLTRAMDRLRALAAVAVKQELPEAAAALEQDLANADETDQRAVAVSLLADLYHALARPADEEALLRRELANPVITGSKDDHDQLAARLEALTGPARFARAVQTWRAAHQPAWYDFAEPASLADPRLRDLDAALKSPDQQFRTVEIVKLRLLVAQDPSQAPAIQRHAWQEAVRILLRLAPTHTEARSLVDSIVNDPGFDEDTHTGILWVALWESFSLRDRADFAYFRQNPVFAKFSDSDRERMGYLTDYMATDPAEKAALVALSQKLTARPLTSMALEVMDAVTDDLLRLGELAAARDLASQAATWQLGSDADTPRQTLQLNFARKIRVAEAIQPTHEALLRRVTQAFPSLPAEPPPEWAALRTHGDMPELAPAIMRPTCLWLVRTQQFDHTSLEFWGALLKTLSPDPADHALEFDLVRLVLEQAGDDAQRANAIDFVASSVDTDDPDTHALLDSLFAKYNQPAAAPLTATTIRLWEIRLAVRTGRPAVDLTTAFDGIRLPGAAQERLSLQLGQALQTRDTATLKQLVDAMPPEQLLGSAWLHRSLPALELLGLKDQAQLAREAARRELHQAVLFSWADPDEHMVMAAYALAETLNEPGLLPPAWVAFIRDYAPGPYSRLCVLWVDAMQRKDFTAAIHAAEELVKLYPTYYNTYWCQAQALWSAGRKADAAGPLTTYVRYSKNEVDYPEAVARLKELGQPVP